MTTLTSYTSSELANQLRSSGMMINGFPQNMTSGKALSRLDELQMPLMPLSKELTGYPANHVEEVRTQDGEVIGIIKRWNNSGYDPRLSFSITDVGRNYLTK